MCNRLEITRKKQATVWKIIAEKDGDYYSPAIGCKYPKNGDITIAIKQQCLSDLFCDDILDEESGAFNKKMIGRTAGFKYKCDAESEYWILLTSKIHRGYKISVKKAVLTKGIMEGVYGFHKPVYAGKHIEFLE
jgi:hypothetical protein